MSWKDKSKILISPLRRILPEHNSIFRDTTSYKNVMALHGKGDYKKAYDVLSIAITRGSRLSKVADIYILFAELELLANEDPHKALEALDKAQEMGCTQIAYYYLRRAEALWRIGEIQTALQCFEKSVEAEPCAFYRSNLAQALAYLDDERARSVWQEVLEEEPENSQAHSYFAFEAAKSGDRDNAIVMAKKADKLASSKEDSLDVAALYHELGEFQTAIKKYLEVVKFMKLNRQRGWVYARIAGCYLSMGQTNLARNYLKRALKYCPDDEDVKEIQREFEEKSAK